MYDLHKTLRCSGFTILSLSMVESGLWSGWDAAEADGDVDDEDLWTKAKVEEDSVRVDDNVDD